MSNNQNNDGGLPAGVGGMIGAMVLYPIYEHWGFAGIGWTLLGLFLTFCFVVGLAYVLCFLAADIWHWWRSRQ